MLAKHMGTPIVTPARTPLRENVFSIRETLSGEDDSVSSLGAGASPASTPYVIAGIVLVLRIRNYFFRARFRLAPTLYGVGDMVELIKRQS